MRFKIEPSVLKMQCDVIFFTKKFGEIKSIFNFSILIITTHLIITKLV